MSIPAKLGMSRRNLIIGGAGVAVGGPLLLRPVEHGSPPPVETAGPQATEPFTAVREPRLLQILAHPDDDLYFMNPDTLHALEAGVPVASVYVTAGDANGINEIRGGPPRPADRRAYSSARHQGLRQAYAAMLGLDVFTPWRCSALPLPGGVTAELNTLEGGGRRADLVFLNLSMGEGRGASRFGLPHLWQVPRVRIPTVVATDSVVRAAGVYRHPTLVDALVSLMDRYRPTMIQTLDPDPDLQEHDAEHSRGADQRGFSDHRDHTAAALFTWKAIVGWVDGTTRRDGRVPRFTTTSYRGYYNQRWPFNLPPEIVDLKAEYLESYGGAYGWDCGNTAGCGDYNVGLGRPLANRKGWVRSTQYRHPGPRSVAEAGPDGRITVYGVLGTRAVRWRETATGSGQWSEPADLGGGPLAPALSAPRDSTGRQFLFALRFSALQGCGGDNDREIVMLEERTPGGSFRPWKSLGNPADEPREARRVGAPVAVATPDGRLHLFARNAAKGVSRRVRGRGGAWGPWEDIGGGEIQDGLAAVLDHRSEVHLFAAGRNSVHHWPPKGPPAPLAGLPRPAGPPSAVLGPDGAITLTYPLPARAEPAVERFLPRGVTPPPDPALPPARVRKDADGTVRLCGDRHGNRGARRPGRPSSVGTPALVRGTESAPVVTGLGFDATPWVWRPAPSA